MVHINLKPENILVRNFDAQTQTINVTLSDVVCSFVSGTGHSYIPPEYAANEQNSEYTNRGNIFILGVILCQLILHDKVFNVTSTTTNFIRNRYGTKYSETLLTLIDFMLLLDPNDRLSVNETLERFSKLTNQRVNQPQPLKPVVRYLEGSNNTSFVATDEEVVLQHLLLKYDNLQPIFTTRTGQLLSVEDKRNSYSRKSILLLAINDHAVLNPVFLQARRIKNTYKHPNLSKICSVFKPGVLLTLCIEMEEVKGSLFSEFVEKRARPREHLLKQIAIQICEALIYLYTLDTQCGVVDINLSTIFVKQIEGQKIQVALCDFGLATVLNDTAIETEQYKAPEVLNHKLFSSASDVFALGVTLYQLMSLDTDTRMGMKSIETSNMKEFILKNTSPFGYSNDFVQLVASMLCFDSKQRISVESIWKQLKEDAMDTRFNSMSYQFVTKYTTASSVRQVSFGWIDADVHIQLSKRYSNVEQLGEGGQGMVYKVFDHRSKKNIALKVSKTSDLNSAIDEVMTMAKLTHPHIVPTYYAFPVGVDTICIEMELLKGSLKQEFIERKIVVSEKILTQIIEQACLALKYLHEDRKVLHRDVKPMNILVKEYDAEKQEIIIALADFGLVKSINNLTNNTDKVGTAEFMAPELLANEQDKFSSAIDVFALGATLYQLMTLDERTTLGVLMQELNKEENPAMSFVRLLAQKSERRYSAGLMKLVSEMLRIRASQRISVQNILTKIHDPKKN